MPVSRLVEGTAIKTCPLWVETVTLGENYDRHTYTFETNPKNNFYFKGHLICLNFVPDFETPPNQ